MQTLFTLSLKVRRKALFGGGSEKAKIFFFFQERGILKEANMEKKLHHPQNQAAVVSTFRSGNSQRRRGNDTKVRIFHHILFLVFLRDHS